MPADQEADKWSAQSAYQPLERGKDCFARTGSETECRGDTFLQRRRHDPSMSEPRRGAVASTSERNCALSNASPRNPPPPKTMAPRTAGAQEALQKATKGRPEGPGEPRETRRQPRRPPGGPPGGDRARGGRKAPGDDPRNHLLPLASQLVRSTAGGQDGHHRRQGGRRGGETRAHEAVRPPGPLASRRPSRDTCLGGARIRTRAP